MKSENLEITEDKLIETSYAFTGVKSDSFPVRKKSQKELLEDAWKEKQEQKRKQKQKKEKESKRTTEQAQTKKKKEQPEIKMPTPPTPEISKQDGSFPSKFFSYFLHLALPLCFCFLQH